ncbi:hypothetical protein C4D60_Mb07t07090 [Musa balbisiana]|uniref:K Homology domain-containing protein n=1 Tax=Musa balbisiana TaxID=52838 RepID=A0A4S8JDI9_MUSBA|nr:hypothetical protein C4D60_Mb07t07090 [Musa balbisiana]
MEGLKREALELFCLFFHGFFLSPLFTSSVAADQSRGRACGDCLLAPLSTSRSRSAVGHRDLARIRIAEDPNLASFCRRSRRNHGFRQVHGLLPFPLRHPLIHQRLCRAGERCPELDCFTLETEILRVTMLLGNASLLDQSGLEHGSPMTTGGLLSNGGATEMNGWASAFQSEGLGLIQPSSAHGWLGSQSSASGLIVKKTIRVDIPMDKYPTYNFVGRLLGPRGNSLKRVEANTDCRILIRGRGSIKDLAKEEMMRGKPGYEHLSEPLHILVEAELPVEIVDARLLQAREILEDLLKPVVFYFPFPSSSLLDTEKLGRRIFIFQEESHDFFKQQQLRELAMINGTLRDEGTHMSGSISPFHSSLSMKRAKTRE